MESNHQRKRSKGKQSSKAHYNTHGVLFLPLDQPRHNFGFLPLSPTSQLSPCLPVSSDSMTSSREFISPSQDSQLSAYNASIGYKVNPASIPVLLEYASFSRPLIKNYEQASTGTQDARQDFLASLSPSVTAPVCPPAADGLDRPAFAASSEVAFANSSAARLPAYFARQTPLSEGPSSSMACWNESNNSALTRPSIFSLYASPYPSIWSITDRENELNKSFSMSVDGFGEDAVQRSPSPLAKF